jgi:hypothetical protein
MDFPPARFLLTEEVDQLCPSRQVFAIRKASLSQGA